MFASSETVRSFWSLRAAGRRDDLDGDGDADVMWFDTGTRQVAVWTLQGSTRTGTVVQDGLDAAWSVAVPGDFDGDGHTDFAFRHTDGSLAMWGMNGAVREVTAILTIASGPLAASARIAGTGDVTGEGRADVLLEQDGMAAVSLTGADRVLGVPVALGAMPAGATIAAVGDLSGDGRADLVWRDTTSGGISVWTLEGIRVATTGVVQAAVDAAWTLAGSGDVDGDGRTDLLWRHSDGRLGAWLMDGVTRRRAGVIDGVTLTTGQSIAAVADYDGNGTDDLLVRDGSSGAVELWSMADGAVVGRHTLQDAVASGWQIVNAPLSA